MDRRSFTASMAGLLVLAGCDTEQKPAPTATLLNNGDVQEALKALSSAIDGLESSVGGFESEDWKEVVPEVDAASGDVRSAFNRLRESLGVSFE